MALRTVDSSEGLAKSLANGATGIALTWQTPPRRLGVRAGEVHVEAIAIDINAAAGRERFVQQWLLGSDAQASYFDRLMDGPICTPEQAVRLDRTLSN